MAGGCPLCDREFKKKTYNVYGTEICKKCATGFANRRQGAYVIDWLFLTAINFPIGMVIGLIGAAMSGGNMTVADQATIQIIATGVGLLLSVVYCIKDGFGGKSLGKLLTGVTSVDDVTAKPIGIGQSFKRNLVIIVPLMPLIIACTMMKGHRAGDGWAGTRVIWDKYRDHWVFNPNVEAPDPDYDGFDGEYQEHEDDDNPYRAPRS